MGNKHFSFGTEPRMRAVPEGKSAELKFSGTISTKDTEWGEKYTFEITLFSHPSYESIPKEGIKTNWESKSQLAEQLYNATSPEAIEKNPNLILYPWAPLATNRDFYIRLEEVVTVYDPHGQVTEKYIELIEAKNGESESSST